MGMLWSPDSDYAKERRRWESTHSEFGPPGRPLTFQEFPLMVYRAKRADAGGKPILEHHIVGDEQEERNMLSRGFVRGPEQAIARLEYHEQELARAAAERAYADQRLSDKAKQEAAKADEATIQHLGEIKETPIRRRVRADEDRLARQREAGRRWREKQKAQKETG